MVAAKEASQTLRHQLEGMKAKLAEAKRNLATLSARNKAAEVRKKVYSQSGETNLEVDDSAFQKFDRMRDKVEQAEAEAEALAELQGIDVTSYSSSYSGVSDADIEDELEALKKKKEEE